MPAFYAPALMVSTLSTRSAVKVESKDQSLRQFRVVPPTPAVRSRFPGQCLLRKEVIQPHVPVGLPCYDLAPVTSLTFGGVPPCGLVCRLRVLPASIA